MCWEDNPYFFKTKNMNIPKNNVHTSCVWKLMMRFTCRIINPKSLKYLFFNQFNFCINKTQFSKSLFFQHKTMIFPNTAVYMWMPHVRSDWSNWPIKLHIGIWYALLCKQHGRWFQNLQILLKIAKKLQIVKDCDKKEYEYQKYIYYASKGYQHYGK